MSCSSLQKPLSASFLRHWSFSITTLSLPTRTMCSYVPPLAKMTNRCACRDGGPGGSALPMSQLCWQGAWHCVPPVALAAGHSDSDTDSLSPSRSRGPIRSASVPQRPVPVAVVTVSHSPGPPPATESVALPVYHWHPRRPGPGPRGSAVRLCDPDCQWREWCAVLGAWSRSELCSSCAGVICPFREAFSLVRYIEVPLYQGP